MIVNETIIVPLGDIDKTKKVGVVITADSLPVFGRIFVHEGFEVLKVETDFTGIIKLFTSENMNRPQVSYDVKVVPTGYKIDPLADRTSHLSASFSAKYLMERCTVNARSALSSSRLLKNTHVLRCAQSPRINVLPMYACARRFFARLACGSF